MNPDDIKFLAAIVESRSGIALSEDKSYLFESRLLPIAKQHGHKDLHDLVKHARANHNEALFFEITDAMTTNESSFFRDMKPFDHLRTKTLPAIMQANSASAKIRMWSAACATGQEAYSIAICCNEEAQKLSSWRVEILATDISRKAVERAKSGVYSQFEVQRGMPVQLLLKYFSQNKELWTVQEKIKDMVTFKEGNLLADLSPLGKFDIIFCRNVLYYFSEKTKGEILDKMAGSLNPGGILYLGCTENASGFTNKLKIVDGLSWVLTPV